MAVAKIIELVGSSEKSWEDAVKKALERASKTIRNIRGIDVLGFKAVVRDNKIVEYRAHIKISFLVEEA
ncbi:MAG: dodecin domain-containing protein [Candidatus Aenigmarchaeota archaeon]|nr:dodecin domain-containing protein [Candidatus Aenigmarchaeota archaeon]